MHVAACGITSCWIEDMKMNREGLKGFKKTQSLEPFPVSLYATSKATSAPITNIRQPVQSSDRVQGTGLFP